MEIVEFINKFRQSAQQTPNKVTIVDEKASCKTTFADFWTFVQKIADKIIALTATPREEDGKALVSNVKEQFSTDFGNCLNKMNNVNFLNE